jgi:hypothetical protein
LQDSQTTRERQAIDGEVTLRGRLPRSEILLREQLGEAVRFDEYFERFPQYAALLYRQLALHDLLPLSSARRLADQPAGRHGPGAPTMSANGHPTYAPAVGPATAEGNGSPGPAAAAFPTIPGYEILGKLPGGGRGVVYKARQVSLQRTVALKMIRDDDSPSAPEDLALFRREAEAVARLQHPHIVLIHDFGEYAGRPYFSMEFVEGGSLDQRLAAGLPPVAEAARLVETLARALHAVHLQGIVHRDLKPGNVLLGAGDTPKIADFGLAKRLGDQRSLLATGTVLAPPVTWPRSRPPAGARRRGRWRTFMRWGQSCTNV